MPASPKGLQRRELALVFFRLNSLQTIHKPVFYLQCNASHVRDSFQASV